LPFFLEIVDWMIEIKMKLLLEIKYEKII
jgi:hypothetical protein